MGQQIVDPFPAMQYLTWAIEEIDKIGHTKLVCRARASGNKSVLCSLDAFFEPARNVQVSLLQIKFDPERLLAGLKKYDLPNIEIKLQDRLVIPMGLKSDPQLEAEYFIINHQNKAGA